MGEYIRLSSGKYPDGPDGVGDDILDEPRLSKVSPEIGLSNMPGLIKPIVPTEETFFSKLLVRHWCGSCMTIPLVVMERRSRFSSQYVFIVPEISVHILVDYVSDIHSSHLLLWNQNLLSACT